MGWKRSIQAVSDEGGSPDNRHSADHYEGAGLVLTGGGARLNGFPELIEAVLDMPVRVGAPTRFSDARFRTPEYSTLVGLVAYGERQTRRRQFSWFSRVWAG